MKEEVIIEGNKLIAEFMGYEYIGGDVMHYPYLRKGDEIIAVHNDVCYHSSWDWLMPVVHKITGEIQQDYPLKTTMITDLAIHTPREDVWEAVVEFIKWYNSQKQEQESNR